MLQVVEVASIHEVEEELTELLIKVVAEGASIGFLPPLDREAANSYWTTVMAPEVILFVARVNQQIAGTVQLHLCTKQNGTHRAEIAKLMTHPDFRRNGVGRALMEIAEERAKQESRSLLVLDTREGDVSNKLYTSIGYVKAGRIPHFAQSPTGELNATILYYKEL
jgi:ribosomal protein S18 acetylase RimI-like enzyme